MVKKLGFVLFAALEVLYRIAVVVSEMVVSVFVSRALISLIDYKNEAYLGGAMTRLLPVFVWVVISASKK